MFAPTKPLAPRTRMGPCSRVIFADHSLVIALASKLGQQVGEDAVGIEPTLLPMEALRAVMAGWIPGGAAVLEPSRSLPARREGQGHHLTGASLRHVFLDHDQVIGTAHVVDELLGECGGLDG